MATWERHGIGSWVTRPGDNQQFNGLFLYAWINVQDNGTFELRHPLFYSKSKAFTDFESAKAMGERWLDDSLKIIAKLRSEFYGPDDA